MASLYKSCGVFRGNADISKMFDRAMDASVPHLRWEMSLFEI